MIVRGAADGFVQEIIAGPHRLRSDEPISVGGTETGATPYDLLLAAVGSCTSMTMGMYARRRKWPLERVTVRLRHSRVHAKDWPFIVSEWMSPRKGEGLIATLTMRHPA